jgi:hypothetical protein
MPWRHQAARPMKVIMDGKRDPYICYVEQGKVVVEDFPLQLST